MPEALAALVPYGLAGLLVLAAYYAERVGARKAEAIRTWRAAAEGCGVTELAWSASRLGQDSHLQGRWGRLAVRFEHSRKRSGVRTTVVVEGPPDGIADITLRSESVTSAVQRGLGGGDMTVGDEAFDRRVHIQGPAAILLAILDAETRRKVLALLPGSPGEPDHMETALVVERGVVRADVHERRQGRFATHLPGALAALLDVARRLTGSEDVAARLAHNACHDPLEPVRLNNLVTLAREHGDEPATLETLRTCCHDSSDEIRLQAAAALGTEARAVLLEIAARAYADEGRAVRAVEALGAQVSSSKDDAAELLDPLAKLLESRAEALGVVAARVLGRTGLPAAEAPLLAALRGAPGVRLEAAKGLARLGTVAAVLPLTELAEREGGIVHKAALAAVAEIQARIAGAAPGQVSLAASEAGSVSLANEEAGQVSLPDTNPRRD